MKKVYSVVLVGGGTGGHIFPLVAIGEALNEQAVSFCYIGSPSSREEAIVTALKWPFVAIKVGKWHRGDFWRLLLPNLLESLISIFGFFQALILLLRIKARLIVSKGGYVSLPVVLAAWLLRRKIIIHESDAVMGLSNRFASFFADDILTAFRVEIFPNCDKRFLQVGIPIRKSLRRVSRSLSPKKERPLILVIGGIQGARAINNIVVANLSNFLSYLDIVHVSGEKDFQDLQEKCQRLDTDLASHYKLFPFLDRQLGYYLRSCDLVISRASATFIAEAALMKKPLILIPLPTAASNHQLINARILQSQGAAYLLEEKSAGILELDKVVKKLLSDKKKLQQMGDNLNRYFHQEESLRLFLKVIKKYV